ncbi:hypothetical protein LJR074_001816 [Acidovorax sp. LjRoot74]
MQIIPAIYGQRIPPTGYRHHFMPLRVYLDSSDYSTLSDPGKASREVPGVLEELLSFKDSGKVNFYFSAAHLTEMAPVQSTYTSAAVQRTNMLADLCGGNCMIHLQTLFKEEVRAALGLSSGCVNPFDHNGRWFPEGACEMLPITETDHLQSIQSTIEAVLPNATRAQKRQAKRLMTKGRKVRPTLRSTLLRNVERQDLDEILAVFPMRQDAARTLALYVAGGATAAEATGAYEASLRDPRWMMQWFEKHHGDLTPFVSWARGPAADITGKMRELSRLVESLRANPMLNSEFLTSIYGSSKWEEWQENMLIGIGNRFAEELKPGAKLKTAEIDTHCPGLSTGIRTLHTSWRSITFAKPRKPKDSDFVDALHAVYAPYVDVFRADGFMADYVSKQVIRFPTLVVPKLSELPEALRRRLATT